MYIFSGISYFSKCGWHLAAPGAVSTWPLHIEKLKLRDTLLAIYIYTHTHTHTQEVDWEVVIIGFFVVYNLEIVSKKDRYFCFVNLIQPIQSKIFLRFCSSRFTWETRGERHGDCDRPSRVYDPTCSVLWIWFRSSHHFRRGGGWWWQTKKNRYSISLCFSP